MANYKEDARHFLETALPYLTGCSMPWQYVNAIREYNRDNKTHILVKNGATRVALIGKTFVVKFDYGYDRCWFGGCYQEYSFYRKVLRDGGMIDCLLECSKIKVNHHFYYVMPKATRIGKLSITRFSAEEEDWLYDNVNDTHDGNIGWYNGRPVVIDYACLV